ncbi:30S ribosomal protein S21 [Patescibacteria group bacterium]|nr:30S ribosomal protein S21 [Patescibacteria group bacterium]
MAIEIRRKEKENSQSLIRRFSRRIQRSGILRRVRKKQFKARPKSRQMKKKAALRREELRIEYQKIKKLGGVK